MLDFSGKIIFLRGLNLVLMLPLVVLSLDLISDWVVTSFILYFLTYFIYRYTNLLKKREGNLTRVDKYISIIFSVVTIIIFLVFLFLLLVGLGIRNLQF